MPNAVSRRRPRRRTNTRRAPRPVTAVIRGSNGIPDRLFNQFPYAQVMDIGTSVLPGSQTFRTSMFDPDYSGTGHQPFMHDELTPLFLKYRCYGIKYDITIENTSTTISARWSLAPFNHTGAPPSMDLLWEKPNGKWGVLGPRGQNDSIARVTGYMSAATVLGVTKERFKNDDIYATNVGANPNVPAYLVITTQASDAASAITVRLHCRLTMFTELFNRATISQS